MPWQNVSAMENRAEFVALASLAGCNISELCRRFGVSRKTGYKWLERHRAEGEEGLRELSRRPLVSPGRTLDELEKRVVELRWEHPKWGGRTLRKVLEDKGVKDVPAASTITDILRRHGLLDPAESLKHAPFKRFEREQPNELWQMDFKGHVATDKGRCHPLTVLDDHSRYAVGLCACENERDETVRAKLEGVFLRYGMPQAILADNGPPWGSAGAERFTAFGVWLLRLGVQLYHGRPHHPQTQGKNERFNRTLALEVLGERLRDVPHGQSRFDYWRPVYNWERPHQALGMEVPGKRYRVSPRPYPAKLPEPEYDLGVAVRKVTKDGVLNWQGREFSLGKGFGGQQVGFRPNSNVDGAWDVLFFSHVVAQLGLDGCLEQL